MLELEKKYPKGAKLVAFFCARDPYYKEKISPDYMEVVEAWDIDIRDLTFEQLRAGCGWWKNSGLSSVPKSPRFRRKCFGLIDSDQAFEIAKEDRHANPAIYGASCKISDYHWKNLSAADLRRKFIQHYALVCESIMNGAIIHVPEKVMQLENNYLVSLSSIKKTEKGIKQARALVELAKKIAAQKEAKYDKLHEVVRI